MSRRKLAGEKGPAPIDCKTVASCAVICGCLCALFLGKTMALETADWAARGQSLMDRQLYRALWGGLGFSLGAFLGTCLGLAWARSGGTKRRAR